MHALKAVVSPALSIAALVFASIAVFAGDLDETLKSGKLRHLGVPYANFISGAGDGLDIELVKGFAKELGVEYQFVKTDWPSLFPDLTGKRYKANGDEVEILGEAPVNGDLAANGLTVLPWREKLVDFSTPTFPNQVWLVARADSPIPPLKPSGDLAKDIEATKDALAGKSILGKAATCLDPSLYKLSEKTDKAILFKGSLNEIAPALLNGEAELTLLDVPDALVALQKWPGKIKIIGPISGKQDMAVAFPKSSPKLRAAFNAYLERIKRDGSYVALVRKYYPFVFDYFPEFFAQSRP